MIFTVQFREFWKRLPAPVSCWGRMNVDTGAGGTGRNGECGKGADEEDAEADTQHELQHRRTKHVKDLERRLEMFDKQNQRTA